MHYLFSRNMNKILVNLILGLSLCASTVMFGAATPYDDYIETYSALAIEQQEEFGIPASITLAQGILESSAGRSTLATEGNNHFGIKCHKEWDGETMLRNDDAPDECFRVYSTPAQSFRDHSLFLKRERYSRLFDLEVTDYAAWANGLKACGYATDPNYGARLITIIERYSLYDFDTEAGRNREETTLFIRDMLTATHPVRRSRGLHYIVATPGDTFSALAREFNLEEKRLREFNDAEGTGEITPWQEIYLEEKLDIAPEGVSSVTIGEDESMHSISQRFGMKLSAIKALNKKVPDRPGSRLKLSK